MGDVRCLVAHAMRYATCPMGEVWVYNEVTPPPAECLVGRREPGRASGREKELGPLGGQERGSAGAGRGGELNRSPVQGAIQL